MSTARSGIRGGASRNGDRRDLVVVGASAGGVPCLVELVKGLPKNFPAAVLVVMHTSPDSPGLLASILGRAGTLPAQNPTDGEPIKPGRIYVAPPDYHMVVEDSTVRLTRGPRENNFRPAIDALFRSAAVARGACVVGVILTGGLDDGTYGLIRIKEQGGVAIVQEPSEALVPGMPESAIRNAEVDHVLPVNEMAPLLSRLASEPCGVKRAGRGGDSKQRRKGAPVRSEARVELEEDAQVAPGKLLTPHVPVGKLTQLTCPECGGTLSEALAGRTSHVLCHLGHAYSEKSLESAKLIYVEGALWAAVRALKESADMYGMMAERATARGHRAMAERFERRKCEAEERAEVILRVLLNDRGTLVNSGEEEVKKGKGKQAARGKRTRKS